MSDIEKSLGIEPEQAMPSSVYPSNFTNLNNGLPTVLYSLGWLVIVASVLVGGVVANVEVTKGTIYTYTSKEFMWSVAIMWWGCGLISGVVLMGIGEIVKVLQKIYLKMN